MFVKDLNTGICYRNKKDGPKDGNYIRVKRNRYGFVIDTTTLRIYQTVGEASVGEGVQYEKMREALLDGTPVNGKLFVRNK